MIVQRPSSVLNIALLATLMAVSACAPREPALNAVDAMRAATIKREEAHQEALRKAVTLCFVQMRERVAADWQKRLTELKLKVYELHEAKAEELSKSIADQLDNALTAPLQHLSTQLHEEQRLIDNGTGSREKLLLLQGQIAAGMTAAYLQKERLDERARPKLLAERNKALAEIDAKMATPPVIINPEQEAAAALAKFDGETFVSEMSTGYDTVKSYIALDSPVGLVLRGLIGGSLGERAAETVESRGRALYQEYEGKAAAEATALFGRWLSDLTRSSSGK